MVDDYSSRFYFPCHNAWNLDETCYTLSSSGLTTGTVYQNRYPSNAVDHIYFSFEDQKISVLEASEFSARFMVDIKLASYFKNPIDIQVDYVYIYVEHFDTVPANEWSIYPSITGGVYFFFLNVN